MIEDPRATSFASNICFCSLHGMLNSAVPGCRGYVPLGKQHNPLTDGYHKLSACHCGTSHCGRTCACLQLLYLRWRQEQVWPAIAKWFDLEAGPPLKIPLTVLMPKNEDVWRAVQEEHDTKVLRALVPFLPCHCADTMYQTSSCTFLAGSLELAASCTVSAWQHHTYVICHAVRSVTTV